MNIVLKKIVINTILFLIAIIVTSHATAHEAADIDAIERYLAKINNFNTSLIQQTKNKTLLEKIKVLGEHSQVEELDEDLYDFLMQQLAVKYPILGDDYKTNAYQQQMRSYSAPLDLTLKDVTLLNAVGVISEQANNYDIVIINEVHHDSRHRTFTHSVLKNLWQQGYRYFAVEGLSEADEESVYANFVLSNSGDYTSEPLFSNLLINARKIGFKLVSYDYYDTKNDASIFNRDSFAAKTITQKTFKQDQNAKVLIHVGYSHASKNKQWLAGILSTKYGKKVLSVDQTKRYSLSESLTNPKLQGIAPPFVLKAPHNQYWSENKEEYDFTVIWPEIIYKNKRPTWAKLHRVPFSLPINFCENEFPCIIEVFSDPHYTGSNTLDRVIVKSSSHAIDVFLRPAYNLVLCSRENGMLIKSGCIHTKSLRLADTIRCSKVYTY